MRDKVPFVVEVRNFNPDHSLLQVLHHYARKTTSRSIYGVFRSSDQVSKRFVDQVFIFHYDREEAKRSVDLWILKGIDNEYWHLNDCELNVGNYYRSENWLGTSSCHDPVSRTIRASNLPVADRWHFTQLLIDFLKACTVKGDVTGCQLVVSSNQKETRAFGFFSLLSFEDSLLAIVDGMRFENKELELVAADTVKFIGISEIIESAKFYEHELPDFANRLDFRPSNAEPPAVPPIKLKRRTTQQIIESLSMGPYDEELEQEIQDAMQASNSAPA